MSGDYGLCELAVVSLGDNDDEPDYEIQLTPDGHINTTGLSSKLSEESHSAISGSKVHYTNGSATVGSSTDASSSTGEVTVCSVHEVALDRYCRTEGRAVCHQCVNQGSCRNHIVIELRIRASAVRVSPETFQLYPNSCVVATFSFVAIAVEVLCLYKPDNIPINTQ